MLTNLEGSEPWHGHEEADGPDLELVLRSRINTVPSIGSITERLRSTQGGETRANLDEPPDQAVDPDPQRHELIVPLGQAHNRQPVQLSLGPEAEITAIKSNR